MMEVGAPRDQTDVNASLEPDRGAVYGVERHHIVDDIEVSSHDARQL